MNYTGIFGFDISTWQDAPTIPGVIDFQKMRDYGGRFVIIKAGQGNWKDADFDVSWKNAKGILPRASYWFYDNRYPPKEQAEKYFEIIKGDLEGMCWLDLEDRQVGIYSGWRGWYDFIVALKEIYPGAQIGIYSNFFYIVEMFSFATREQREYFGKYPLWLANYGADPFKPDYSRVLIPLPWLEYLILQSGTPAIGLEVGVESHDIDYNQFNGDAAKFEKFFGAPPIVEPGEIIMARYEATALGDNTRLRSTHDTTFAYIGNYPRGTKFHGDEVWTATATTSTSTGTIINQQGDEWLRVTDVSGAMTSGWVAIKHKGLDICALTDTQPPTEPPAEYVADFDVTLTAPDGKRYAGTVAGLTLRAVE
jgi:GH25 family lysozyme M1 (1,4-beta-N-acetylmuramidase)